MYSMSIVLARIFPDLIDSDKDFFESKIRIIKSNNNPVEQAIVDLIESMRYKQANKRCSSKDALEFCEKLMLDITDLDTNKLVQLKKDTIARKEISFDDAIRGVTHRGTA